MTNFPNLLSALPIGDLTLPNRVVMAPMTRGRCGTSYSANALMAEYYKQRATAGLLITEGTHISAYGRGWFGAPEIYTAEHADAWKPTTAAVHDAGGHIFCQLWHTGRASHSSFRKDMPGYDGDRALSVAPSAIKRNSETGSQHFTPMIEPQKIETPRALTLVEIPAVVEEYRNAAQKARDAGFDGVEIHSANGYLLDEFLQECSNKRTDAYGGSLENRFHLLDDVVRAVITVFPASRVGVRLSPNGAFNGMGSEENRKSFPYFAKRLSEFGLGYLHVMIGTGFGWHGHGDPLVMADFRKVYPGIMMANVEYTAASAEKEISEKVTDLVAFGRPFIANPDLVERFRIGAELAKQNGDADIYGTAARDPGASGYSDYPAMNDV